MIWSTVNERRGSELINNRKIPIAAYGKGDDVVSEKEEET
jgi:hypothetical protein